MDIYKAKAKPIPGIRYDEVVSFIRKQEDQEVLVMHNVSDVEVTVKMPDALSRFNDLDFDTVNGKVALDNGELTLPAFSTVIIKKN